MHDRPRSTGELLTWALVPKAALFLLLVVVGLRCSSDERHIAPRATGTPAGVWVLGPFQCFGGLPADMCMIRGTVTTAGTAGAVQLQWAQNTSSASATTVQAGSYLQASKL